MAASPVTTTTRLRALVMPIDGHPSYQAMLVQHTIAGPTIPAIASTHSGCTITVPAAAATPDPHDSGGAPGGDTAFAIFYTQLPAARANANRAVSTFLGGRVFFGELVIFRVGSRGLRFVNLRSGDRAAAFAAAARLLDSLGASESARGAPAQAAPCPRAPPLLADYA